MNINRHNYEEFFLLYVDNELTEAERNAVEIFVQQNPDLSDEFKLLQHSTLMPEDHISFINKESLYKNENAISLSNYEEYFLLYVDNELNTKGKEEVEKFVLQHPQVQNEFTLLQKTKLPLETIEFKDKASLYRREEVARRVLPITWMRMAAAAAIISIVATLWITYSNKSIEVQQPVAKVENDQHKAPVIQKPDEIKDRFVNETIKEQVAATKNVEIRKPESTSIKKNSSKKAVENNITISKEAKQEQLPVNKDNLNNLPTPENNPVYTQRNNSNNADRNTRATEAVVNAETLRNSEASLASRTEKGESNSYIQHAVYKNR